MTYLFERSDVKRLKTLLFVLSFLCLAAPYVRAQAPAKEVREQNQFWIGYMTATKLSNKFSWWNDAHFVPSGFFIVRTGLTFYFPERANLTAGYARLALPGGGVSSELKRSEHRPWAQLIVNSPLPGQWSHLMRIRYDARYRHKLTPQGTLDEGYGFNNRVRFLSSFRHRFEQFKLGEHWLPFFNISDEVLVNFGREVVFNHLDQNRFSLTLGMQHKGLTAQMGYMNRFVQLSSGNRFVLNHTLIVWITHNLDGRRLITPAP